MMRSQRTTAALLMIGLAGLGAVSTLPACSSTTAVRTSDQKYKKTSWKDIQVLTVRPDRPFEEIGTLNSSGWKQKKTKALYEDLRKQAAKLGAQAVLITESGVSGVKDDQWLRAAAIRFVEEESPGSEPGSD